MERVALLLGVSNNARALRNPLLAVSPSATDQNEGNQRPQKEKRVYVQNALNSAA